MMNFIGFSVVFAIVLVAAIIALGVWVWSIIDCATSNKPGMEKLLWILVILLFNIIGSIVYFLFKNTNVDRPSKKPSVQQSLKRSSHNRIVAGVCGGIAEYFHTDPTIVRLVWVLLTIFSFGTGVLLYLIAAVIIPGEAREKRDQSSSSGSTSKIVSTVVIAVCAVVVVLIVSCLVAVVVAINAYDESGVAVRSVTVHTGDDVDYAEMTAADYIRTHPHYVETQGHNLFCHTVERVDDSSCPEFRDPYGIEFAGPECYEVTCMFRTGDNESFSAAVLIARNTVHRLSFSTVPSPLMPPCEDGSKGCVPTNVTLGGS